MSSTFARRAALAALATAGALVGGLFATAASAQEITIKYANVMAPAHDTSKGVDKFAELVAKKSNGRIKVQHFPGGQLGSDKETYEAAQQGLLQIAGGSYANLVTITRAFEVLHLPYIFDSRSEAHRALDSAKVREAINKELDQVGLRWLMTFEFGFRDINTTSKKVLEPGDLGGLKIRVSRSPTEVGGVKAFGGTPVTVDWPEVYNALRFKVVDGEAQPFGTMVSAKHHEIIKEHLELDWQYYGFVGMISTKQWNAYPQWARKVIEEAATEAEQYHRRIWAEEDEKAKAAYLKAGGQITVPTPAQRALWVKAGQGMWGSSGIDKSLIDLVRAEATATAPAASATTAAK
ncbi:TRAP transporter substrate-binding protein [Hydrogenophaga sp. YM1]|uniref:TRAP transporter substrate-binding protein n=1 Tax=Hydrogenophaga sp. YM1 TaxID=2806262 RepID=UPI00195910EB|nr:TRAP transporter substrate-binding protein [Hydrogenophaga sp. YM1]QRR33929.1 TRAP transporter substrate-binding protein [Hydrogenophaga sp. YM1]